MLFLLFLLEMGFITVGEAYDHGYDCGKNGPDTTNSDSSIFYTPTHTRAWHQGKADAEARRARQTGPIIATCPKCGANHLSFCHHQNQEA